MNSKALRRGAVLKPIICNSLVGIFVQLLQTLSNIMEAKSPSTVLLSPSTDLSFHPPSAIACETLQVEWRQAPYYPNLYTVRITDSGDDSGLQTLFQTTVPSPTTSVAWLVNATGGSQLHLAIFAQKVPQIPWAQIHTKDFQPDTGYTTNCITSVLTVCCIMLYFAMKLNC